MATCGRDWQDDRAIEKLKAWIQRQLGCDVIGVELSDDQLQDAVDDAQEYWQMWVGNVKAVTVNITSDVEYPAASIAEDVDSVVDVAFDRDANSFRDVYAWADVEINPFQYLYRSHDGQSALLQYLHYEENAQRILSADRDWSWDRPRRTLIISPSGGSATKMMVFYLSRCFDYLKLSTYEWHLFREYCLGKAMMILANIRSKFDNLPSASGDTTLNGESMYANAEAKLLQIEEKMRQMQRPTGILVG